MEAIIYIKDYWSVILFGGSALCYLIGYIKSLILFRAINLVAIPTDIYTPFSLLVSGLTFIVCALSIPIIVWGSYQLFTLATCSFPFLQNIVNKYFKITFSPGLGFAVFLVPIVASFIPIMPVFLIREYTIYIALFSSALFMVLAFGIYAFVSSQQKGARQWFILIFSISLWLIAMFLGQIYSIKNIEKGESYQMNLLGQQPGITGFLIIKDNINGSMISPEFAGSYKIYGILLAKNDKLYYFAVLPRESINSDLYILPEDRVYGFQAIISFEQFKVSPQ